MKLITLALFFFMTSFTVSSNHDIFIKPTIREVTTEYGVDKFIYVEFQKAGGNLSPVSYYVTFEITLQSSGIEPIKVEWRDIVTFQQDVAKITKSEGLPWKEITSSDLKTFKCQSVRLNKVVGENIQEVFQEFDNETNRRNYRPH